MSIPPTTGKRSFEQTQPLSPEKKRQRTEERDESPQPQTTPPLHLPFHGLSSQQIVDMLGTLSSIQLPTALSLIQPQDLKKGLCQISPDRKKEILEIVSVETLQQIIKGMTQSEFLDLVQMNHVEKTVIVPALDDYWYFGSFLDTLSLPQDNCVVERMCDQQYEWAFDWVPIENIPLFIDALPKVFIEEQIEKIERLLDDTEERFNFTHTQIALAYATSPDLPDALVRFTEQFSERQLAIAVSLCPDEKIANLYTQFPPNEVISRIAPLIPLMSDAKVAALANLTFVPSMLPLLTNRQLIACIPYIELKLLKKILPYMTLEQLSVCARTISEYKRKQLTKILQDNFRFPTEDNAKTFENFTWWQIGIAITIDNRYEILKNHFEDMTPFQFETAMRCMTTSQKTTIYFSLPERLRARLIQLLIPKDMTEIEENADQILPDLVEKISLHQKELENTQEKLGELESELGLLEQNHESSQDSVPQTQDLTSKLTRCERRVLELHQKLKSAVESSTFYRDYYYSIRIGTPKSEKLCATFCSYNEETQQLLTKISTDLKIRLERIRSRISLVESDSSQALEESVVADRNQIMQLYLGARTAIQKAEITEAELDEQEISWDDLVKAGLTSIEVLEARGVSDVLSLKRYLGDNR